MLLGITEEQTFDWDKPITENVEVEMKMLNGILDNDFFEGVSEGMNGGN